MLEATSTIDFAIKSDLVQKTTQVTTRDNTKQHKATRVQHDTTGDNTITTRHNTTQHEYNTVQHETKRVEHDTTRDNTSTT